MSYPSKEALVDSRSLRRGTLNRMLLSQHSHSSCGRRLQVLRLHHHIVSIVQALPNLRLPWLEKHRLGLLEVFLIVLLGQLILHHRHCQHPYFGLLVEDVKVLAAVANSVANQQLDTVRAWHPGPRLIVEVDLGMEAEELLN